MSKSKKRGKQINTKGFFLRKKILTWIVAAGATIAFIALLITNTKTIIQTKSEVFHKKSDDIIIVDNYVNEDTVLQNTFKQDTLLFRLLNNGSQTIALREAQFFVDSVWNLDRYNCTTGIDGVSALYGVVLPNSSPPYVVTARLKQSIKPNESDLFGFLMQGGEKVNDPLKLESEQDTYSKAAYFIQFRVKFFLNNTSVFIETKPIIHFFGSGIVSYNQLIDGGCGYDSEQTRNLTASNFNMAKHVNGLTCYKSPSAINALKDILAKEKLFRD